MITLTIEKENIDKTNFLNLKELFDYAIDNQIISELGIIDSNNLSEKSRKLFENSKNLSNLINI